MDKFGSIRAFWLWSIMAYCACSPSGHFRFVSIFAGPLSDLGWIHNIGKAHYHLHDKLLASHKNLTVDSRIVTRMGTKTADIVAVVDKIVMEEGFEPDLIFGPHRPYQEAMLEVAKKYPTIAVAHWNTQQPIEQPPNFISSGISAVSTWYLLGRLAQRMTQTKVLCALGQMDFWKELINSFIQGAKAVNSSTVVRVAFYQNPEPPSDLAVWGADLMLAHNCDVLYYMPGEGKPMEMFAETGRLLVGGGQDWLYYQGAEVLSSSVWRWEAVYEELAEDLIHNKQNGNIGMWSDKFLTESGQRKRWATVGNGVELGQFSPKVPQTVRQEILAEYDLLVKGTHPSWSGDFETNDTHWLAPDNTWDLGILKTPQSKCGAGHAYTWDPIHAVLLCTKCPPGSVAVHATLRHCQVCPPNTYSDVEGTKCTHCEHGYISSEGSTSCELIVTEKDRKALAVAFIVAFFCAILLVGMLAFGFYRYGRHKAGKHAPRGGEACIVFTDIQGSTALWQTLGQHDMKLVYDIHNRIIRDAIQHNNGYEVKTIGDSFMAAFKECRSAFAFVIAVQKSLTTEKKWPPSLYNADRITTLVSTDGTILHHRGLLVRIGCHCGQVQVEKNPLSGRYDYHGVAVNTASRVESLAYGGQILLTKKFYQQLLSSIPSSTHLPDYDVVELGDFQLKGIMGKTGVVQVSPACNKNWEFPSNHDRLGIEKTFTKKKEHNKVVNQNINHTFRVAPTGTSLTDHSSDNSTIHHYEHAI